MSFRKRAVLKTTSLKLVLIGAILGLLAGSIITTTLILGEIATQTTTYETITRYITKTTTITTTIIIHSTSQSHSSSCIVFKALKDEYKISEPVTFRLINNCDENLILPNSAPWTIKNSEGETVFTPISLQVVTKVKPGDFKEWSWNQKDNHGENVKPGTYYIEIKTNNQGMFKIRIRIIN